MSGGAGGVAIGQAPMFNRVELLESREAVLKSICSKGQLHLRQELFRHLSPSFKRFEHFDLSSMVRHKCLDMFLIANADYPLDCPL